MADSNLVYRVIGWDDSHETPQSLKKQGPRDDVVLPANLGTTAIQTLMRSPAGPAILGVWYVVQMLAAKAPRRGVLLELGSPLTANQLAQITGWDISLIDHALTVLCQPGTRYLEQVPLDVALQPPLLPEPKPRAPRKPKPQSYTHCPVCDADLVAWANGVYSHPIHQIQVSRDDTPVADAASVRNKREISERIDPTATPAEATKLSEKLDLTDGLIASHSPLGLESQTTSAHEELPSVQLAQSTDHCDAIDAEIDFAFDVPADDDQGRRAELRSISKLVGQSETGQVEPRVLEEYLESQDDRFARRGENLISAAPANKSPPTQVPRQKNRPPPNRSQRKIRQQKRRKNR